MVSYNKSNFLPGLAFRGNYSKGLSELDKRPYQILKSYTINPKADASAPFLSSAKLQESRCIQRALQQPYTYISMITY